MMLAARRLALVSFAVGICGVATMCSDSTAPRTANYSIVFHQDSAWALDAVSEQCLGQMYCHTWSHTTADMNGELRQDSDSIRLTVGTVKIADARSATVSFDSTQSDLANRMGPGCADLTFKAADRAGELRGTWKLQTDCHGSYLIGTLVGHRE
jgi:hypothetical protein